MSQMKQVLTAICTSLSMFAAPAFAETSSGDVLNHFASTQTRTFLTSRAEGAGGQLGTESVWIGVKRTRVLNSCFELRQRIQAVRVVRQAGGNFAEVPLIESSTTEIDCQSMNKAVDFGELDAAKVSD